MVPQAPRSYLYNQYRVARITKDSAESSQCNEEQLKEFFKSGSLPTSPVIQRGSQSIGQLSNKSHEVYLSCVYRHNGKIDISDCTFNELLRSMNAGLWVMDFIKWEYIGFFYKNEPNGSATFLAGTDSYQILWTMPIATKDIDIMHLMLFIHPHSETELEVKNAVDNLIQRFIELFQNPPEDMPSIYLPFVTLARRDIEWRKKSAWDIGKLITSLEKESGYSPPSSLLPYKDVVTHLEEPSIEETIKRSRDLGQQMVQITVSLGNAEAAREALEYVEMHVENHQVATPKLNGYVLLLKQQLESTVNDFKRLQERVRAQQSVNFIWITHQDAKTSINLADATNKLTKASNDLAGANKKDGSAMKTIAVVTMSFLPATFFAVLFAVPSLKWDDATVIGPRYWVYWAFTIPSTIFVFGIYFCREWISGRFRAGDE